EVRRSGVHAGGSSTRIWRRLRCSTRGILAAARHDGRQRQDAREWKKSAEPPHEANLHRSDRNTSSAEDGRPGLPDDVLDRLHRPRTHFLRRRLRGDGDRFLPERIDALPFLRGGLLHDDELREPGKYERSGFLQLFVSDLDHGVEHGPYVFFGGTVAELARHCLDECALGHVLRHLWVPLFRTY